MTIPGPDYEHELPTGRDAPDRLEQSAYGSSRSPTPQLHTAELAQVLPPLTVLQKPTMSTSSRRSGTPSLHPTSELEEEDNPYMVCSLTLAS
jgi:hypothetical protein